MTIGGPDASHRSNEPQPGSPLWPAAAQHPPRRGREVMVLAAIADAATGVLGVLVGTALLGSVAHVASDWVYRRELLLAGLLLVALFGALELYATPRHGPCKRFRLRCQGAMLLAAGGFLVVQSTNGLALAAFWALLVCASVIVLGYIGETALMGLLSRIGHVGASAAIIGTDERARTVALGLIANPDVGLRPIGFLALAEQPTVGTELPLPILSRLESYTGPQSFEVAIIASSGLMPTPASGRPFLNLATIDSFDAIQKLRLSADAAVVDQNASGLPASSLPLNLRMRILKRSLDLLLTLPVAVLAAPVVLVSILAVRHADPGPAIYVQERIGYRGRKFKVYKIRTMYQDAEQRLERCLQESPALAAEWQANFKLRNDPRVLPGIGQLLRRFSLDELPQVWNVLKGDMSLVGPRPFPEYHLSSFDEAFREKRATVMPGLTGLWQITARSDGDTAVQKAQDLLYIDNWSIWLDLKILLDTAPAVLTGKGAR